jgi:DNA-binding SARP family transcriptional activator
VRLPSGSILTIGLAAALAGMAALIRRRWRQHRLPADPSAADPPRPQLPAVATAAEAAWLATQRRTHEPDDTGPTQDATFGDEPVDEADEDPLDGAGPDQETGHHPDPQASVDAEVDPAAADRGLTPGGLPAPSLLDLVGQPAGRGLAERVWAGGAGLTGMGAAGAARAVLARLLTSCGPMGAQLLTTAAAAAELLPAETLDRLALVPGVRVFPTLPAVLTAAEAELLGRARRLADTDSTDLTAYRHLPDAEPVPAVLLLAHTPDSTAQTARAAAILQLAAGRDLGAIWLGGWPPATMHVTADGTLHTTDEPRAAVGRVEILTAADAADLLAGLLPAVRDSLDVLDPTALLPAPAPVVDEPAEDAGERAEEPGAAAETAGAADVAALGAGRPAGPAVLAVGVLGRVRLTAASDGREVTGLRAKVRDLLALLAVHPDGLGTEQVGEALWPDAPPGRVGGRLSATLALARRALRDAAGIGQTDASPAGDGLTRAGTAGEADGPVDLLPRTDGRYQLHPDLIDTDHRQFTTALATARRAAEAGDTAGQLAGLQLAADLYRGEALDGVAYPWAEPVRETLRRQGTDALASLADLLTTAAASGDAGGGQRQAALAALERAVEVDPYNEELYRRIMRLHAEAGRTDAVRRTFRLLEARLADLDVDPDPDTASLAAQLTRPAPRPRPARTAVARR